MNTARAELIHRTAVSDANVAGNVHGGWILELLDDAAVIAATRHSRTRVVSAPTEVPNLAVGAEATRRWDEAQLRREIRLAAPADLHELHALLRADTPWPVA